LTYKPCSTQSGNDAIQRYLQTEVEGRVTFIDKMFNQAETREKTHYSSVLQLLLEGW